MSESNHIAYLSYDGLTDPLGQSQILPYILGLEVKGYSFTIISFEKPDTFLAGRIIIERIIEKKKISWIPLKYHKRPPVLSTLLDIYFLWRTMRKTHNQNPFAIIHCRSYITSLVGLRMKHKTGVKFIFDMRGFWADERVEGGIWNLKNPVFKIIYNYFKKKEKEFLTNANQVISLTENAKQEILSWNIKSAPIVVIPTCVDLNLFDPDKITKKDQEALRAQLRIHPNDFVLIYLGSWGTWYLTREILAFFSELKKQRNDAKFLIVSNDEINLEGYQNKSDTIIVHAPRHLVPLYISVANASVFFIKPSFSKKASSATKMGEIMAMNKPVITNKGWGDVELSISDSSTGYRVNDFSEQSVRDSLYWVEKGFAKSRQMAINLFDLDMGIDRYDKIYASIN
ncbi:MAG: glycosyltransferase [Bacteroidetes bacterium]|nr:glycosyltransferase [Bacteroidota bacterium]